MMHSLHSARVVRIGIVNTVDDNDARGTTVKLDFGLDPLQSRKRSPSRIVSDPSVNGVGDQKIGKILRRGTCDGRW